MSIIETSPSAMLIIAGKAQLHDQSEFEDLIVRPNLRASVRANWRFVPDSQVSWYFRATVVTLPYVRVHQSGVCFGAYAFSHSVIVSSEGGIPEQVSDGETGYLVPPADPQSLADALIKILRL